MDLTELSGFFGPDFGFKSLFGFGFRLVGLGSTLVYFAYKFGYFRVIDVILNSLITLIIPHFGWLCNACWSNKLEYKRNEGLAATTEMETVRVDRPVWLPVGSRFFDQPVKPVEIPVKFFFLATKRVKDIKHQPKYTYLFYHK